MLRSVLLTAFLLTSLVSTAQQTLPGDSVRIKEVAGPRFLKYPDELDSSGIFLMVHNASERGLAKEFILGTDTLPSVDFGQYDLCCIPFCHGCRGWTTVDPFLGFSEDGKTLLIRTFSTGCYTHRCISTGVKWLLIPKKRQPLPLSLYSEHEDIDRKR